MNASKTLALCAGLTLSLAWAIAAGAQTPPAPPTAGEPTATAQPTASASAKTPAPPKGDDPSAPANPPDIPLFDDPMMNEDPSLGLTSTSELFGSFLKMILMLGLVLAVVYLTLNKGVGKLIQRTQQGKRVRVVERVPLEQRRALYVVDVDGREMLLAASEGGVTVLDRMDGRAIEPEQPRRPFRIEASGNARAPVSEAFSRKVDDEPAPSDTDATLTISDVQRES